jgi:hypothetical protein
VSGPVRVKDRAQPGRRSRRFDCICDWSVSWSAQQPGRRSQQR